MRIAVALLSVCLLLTGCLHPKPAVVQPGPTTVIAPDFRAIGQIELVNPVSHFVVVSFPNGYVAAKGHQMDIYRQGLKIGEIKVTGPRNNNDTVADIVSGDPKVSDEAREQ